MEYRLNCVDDICPVPLLKTADQLEKMGQGDKLIIKTQKMNTAQNLLNWAKEKGYEASVIEVEDGEWDIVIEKR